MIGNVGQKSVFASAKPAFGVSVSELRPVKDALQELVHHQKPIADISLEVTKRVQAGEGRRTKAIIKELYDPKAHNPFAIKDEVFNLYLQQIKYLDEHPLYYPSQIVTGIKKLHSVLFNAVKKFGPEVSEH